MSLDLKQEILLDYRREKRMQERQLRDEHFREVHDKVKRVIWCNDSKRS